MDEELVLSRFWAKVVKTDTCWLWQGSKTRGYGQLSIGGKIRLAHRFIWQLSNGPIPVGLVIMHKCDVRNCVRLDHLQLGTQSENMLDAYQKGRLAKPWLLGGTNTGRHGAHRAGDSHYNVKIPDSEIPVIRARAAAGEKPGVIARDYGVTSQNIYLIVKCKSRVVKQKETEVLENGVSENSHVTGEGGKNY